MAEGQAAGLREVFISCQAGVLIDFSLKSITWFFLSLSDHTRLHLLLHLPQMVSGLHSLVQVVPSA